MMSNENSYNVEEPFCQDDNLDLNLDKMISGQPCNDRKEIRQGGNCVNWLNNELDEENIKLNT